MFKTALKFILYDKPKSFGALAGIVISIFLVGQQAGIFIFLTNAMKSLVANNDQYIWVVDGKTEDANQLADLDTRIGRQIASLPGIEKVYQVVKVAGGAKFENGNTAGMTIIGSEAPEFVGGPWNLSTVTKEAMLPDGAIITEFFDIRNYGGLKEGEYFELNGNKVYNAGLTKGVRGFGGAPYVFTTIERARAIGKIPTYKASFFLVKWDKKIPIETIIDRINTNISYVRAWDPQKLAEKTVSKVLKSSGIALSVGSLIIFAILSGLIIIGLTLYSAAIDRIKDYGTLKAIGATNGYITRLIMTQALIISLVGFIIGRGLVEGFRLGVAKVGTYFEFPPYMQIGFFLLTIVISLIGSFFAIKRINSLEPAQVFRG
jgi:putative ABC transport system permease protein